MTAAADTVHRIDAGRHLDLLCEAAEVVISTQYAHDAQIRRRVRVGALTASVLLSLLEEAGVIGPVVGGQKERDILVPRDQMYAALAILRGPAATS